MIWRKIRRLLVRNKARPLSAIFFFWPDLSSPKPQVKEKLFHYDCHDEHGIGHFYQCAPEGGPVISLCLRASRSGETVPCGMSLGRLYMRDDGHYYIEDLEEMTSKKTFEDAQRFNGFAAHSSFGEHGVN